MSEKLCLKWNDFQENVNAAFGNLREDSEFADVTLACEDGQQLDAHKVILAASSPFFQNLLKINKHPHPLIYMRGIKSADLQAIIDFLYCGEANVFQENLDSFLVIAEELKLKGLRGGQTEDVEEKKDYSPQPVNSEEIYKLEKSNLNNQQIQSSCRPKRENVHMDNERRITIDEIQKKVSSYYHVKHDDLISSRRIRTFARPRQIAMYLSKKLTTRSLPEIGRKFGGRDHTTVIHAVKKIEELKSNNTKFEEDINLITQMITSI